MRLFGLIGYPLSHSFSKKYFSEKFQKEKILDAQYELFEITSIDYLPEVLRENKNLRGLNVTIPYKNEVMRFLDHLDASAEKVGAVNVVKISNSGLTGFNSDYFGFKESLIKWLPESISNMKAAILGTGGASKAVKAVLQDLNMEFAMVSRNPQKHQLTYQDFNNSNLLKEFKLIINTTPLGMSPQIDTAPQLPYDHLTADHYLFDLVYNPLETKFLQYGKEQNARVKNGLEMLYLQAEKSWEIWNSP